MTSSNLNGSIRDYLNQARDLLNTEAANLECQLILADVLGKERTWLLAHDDESLSDQQSSLFFKHIQQRAQGYPVAYILGHQEFWSLRFAVNESTLIPRPDTELLVEETLALHPDKPIAILDLGTGSGAIAIALALEHAEDTIVAMDCSARAIAVAEHNKQTHEAHNVSLMVGNWCASIEQQSFDIVVSNPPYIEDRDKHLDALKYEPKSALTSGESGLDDIQKISRDAKRCLKSKGYLVVEHGYDQQAAVMAIFAADGYTNIVGKADLGGNPRIVTAQTP